jgi:hypothetical protein
VALLLSAAVLSRNEGEGGVGEKVRWESDDREGSGDVVVRSGSQLDFQCGQLKG